MGLNVDDFWQLMFAIRAHKDDDPFTAGQYADKAVVQYQKRRNRSREEEAQSTATLPSD